MIFTEFTEKSGLVMKTLPLLSEQLKTTVEHFRHQDAACSVSSNKESKTGTFK